MSSSDAASGWALTTRNLGVQLTLFQPEGTDYAHHITACPPGFENLTAYLSSEFKNHDLIWLEF
jgi:hypothetical protein